MCAHEDTLAKYLGVPFIDDVMRYNKLITNNYSFHFTLNYVFVETCGKPSPVANLFSLNFSCKLFSHFLYNYFFFFSQACQGPENQRERW